MPHVTPWPSVAQLVIEIVAGARSIEAGGRPLQNVDITLGYGALSLSSGRVGGLRLHGRADRKPPNSPIRIRKAAAGRLTVWLAVARRCGEYCDDASSRRGLGHYLHPTR